MKLLKKAVLPLGFKANGISAGIKRSGKPDLALFYSEVPAKAAALFTVNKIQAAPVKVSQSHLKSCRDFQAIIANSGNANCFTGVHGINASKATAAILAQELGIKDKSVLVASTGIIGKPLPTEKVAQAVPELVLGLSKTGISKAAQSILTTDTFKKIVTLQYKSGSEMITICAVSKGSGMIAPNMATMLSFIFTDALISQSALNKALKAATEQSFNCITVDGCMSTNDTVAILANGAIGNQLIDSGISYKIFAKALAAVCLESAKLLVRDAEGGKKFIQVKVSGAKNSAQAKLAAFSIANSNLFKTAVYGENPNFGRIAAAIGASGAEVEENKLRVKVSNLKKKDIFVDVALGAGKSSATVYTCDLTLEYIKINAEYN